MTDTLAGRIIRAAEAEVGTVEEPLGSNTGERVRAYQGSTYLAGTGWPWCAAFWCWCLRAAGVPKEVAWQIASPSVARSCDNARALGLICPPRPGAAIAWYGVHVEILHSYMGGGVWRTIGGNTGDAVRHRTRSVAGAVVFGPPGLEDTSAAVLSEPLYWLEDLGAAERFAPGRWDRRSYAERALSHLDPAAQRLAAVTVSEDGWWRLRVGQPRHYGPWIGAAGKVARDGDGPGGAGARAALERRLGRRLRPYRTERMPRAPRVGDALGKTT